MLVSGIDIGSLSAKALIMEDDKVISSSIILTGPDSAETAKQVIEQALNTCGLTLRHIEYIISTGYGRAVVPFAQKNITEISCHARGTVSLFPQVRTILDMGGQDCKAIRCDDKGRVVSFAMNDKCAAGTGRYLERVALTLGLPLQHMGSLSLQTIEGPLPISNYCAVFAQDDILSLLRQGKSANDILAGACEALVQRIQPLLNRIGVVEDFSISGGIAKNIGVVKRLERNLGVQAYIHFEPQIVGALGAALFAQDIVNKGEGSL